MKGLCAVFIHGFMGSPRQFARLAGAARQAGTEARLIGLPGHGGDVHAFAGCGRREWAAHAEAEIAALKAEFGRLILIGHSMGGLLAINAAAKDPAGVAGILALALPLRLHMTGSTAKLWLACIRGPKAGEHPRMAAGREMCGVSGIRLRDVPALLPNSLGLLRIMGEAERALPRLDMPLAAVNSAGDEIVSMRSLPVLKRRMPGAEAIELLESGHFWYSERDQASLDRILTEAVMRWGQPAFGRLH